MIIDEIQNLISEAGSNYKKLLYAIKFYAHPSFRIIALTGTPIYDKPYEFGLLMNLLRTRLVFPDNRKEFNELFLDPGSMKNVDTFKKMCSGYVSYFKGGNPVAYPYKKTIIMYHEMEQYQYDKYKKVLSKEVTRDMNSKLKTDEIHNIAYGKLKDKEINSGIYNKSNLFCNIAFPEINISTAREKAFLKSSVYQFKEEIKRELQRNPRGNILNLVRVYSSKFAKIAEIILKSEGPVFVYSNYVVYGVDALAVVMEAVGYQPFPKKGPNGSYFVWKGDAKKEEVAIARKIYNSTKNIDGSLIKIMFGTQTIMEGVDFKNVRQIHIVDPWWNDSRLQQIIARGIRLCSHKELPPEKRIVDVFIHLAALNTSNHIYRCNLKSGETAYVENKSTLNQVFTKLTNDKENQVNIYPLNKTVNLSSIEEIVSVDPYISILTHGWKELDNISIQQYMFNLSIKKLNINRQFEMAIKEVAIDCEINKNGNLVRLDEKYTPISGGQYYKLSYENYATGEIYTRIENSVVKSQFNPELPDNILSLEDILSNVAANTKNYTFKNTNTGEIVKKLIIPENISCQAVDYTFENLPTKISDLTINKQLIPQLMKLNPDIIYNYLYNITQKNITSTDDELPNKIKKFMSKSYVVKKHQIIEKLSKLGYEAPDDIWDLYTFKELKNEYDNLLKIK